MRMVAPLKPEIRLSQAISEYELLLSPEHKVQLRNYRTRQQPSPLDVLKLSAELNIHLTLIWQLYSTLRLLLIKF